MDATETALTPPDVGVAVPWSEEVGAAIIAKHAEGMPLYRIAALAGMPSVVTMYEWRTRHPEWATVLAHARQVRADRLADEGLGLVDGCDGDSASQVGKAREQANYRRWLAGCLDRDTYGERPPQVNVQVANVVAAFGRLSSPKGDVADE